MGQQREHGGVVRPGGTLAEQQLDEAVGHLDAGLARRFGDRAAQVRVGHRRDRQLVGADRGHEFGMPQQRGVEVGPQPDHDQGPPRTGGGAQRGDERLPLRAVLAGGERLLELVDDQQQAVVRVLRRARRVLAQARRHLFVRHAGRGGKLGRELVEGRASGGEQPHRPAVAGQAAAPHRVDQPGAQQRRLARAGRADDDLHPAARRVRGGETVDQLGGECLAPEEPLRVLGFEARQAPVRLRALRAGARRAPQALPGRHPLGGRRGVGDAARPQHLDEELTRGRGGQAAADEPVADGAVVAVAAGPGRDLADAQPRDLAQQGQLPAEVLPVPDPLRTRGGR
nr:hypothetical protein GCM10020092_073440 [Actinoplanes digitatis]